MGGTVAPATAPAAQGAGEAPPLVARGKFFFRGDEKVYLRGVTYGPFAPGPEGHQFPDPTHARRDFTLMRELGANALRCFTVPPRSLLDLAHEHDLGVGEEAKNAWYRHWVERGLGVVERQLAAAPARFCHGDTPTLADCVLVPQIFNARRFDARLDHVPHVMRVFDACMALPAFEHARPEACPDATA